MCIEVEVWAAGKLSPKGEKHVYRARKSGGALLTGTADKKGTENPNSRLETISLRAAWHNLAYQPWQMCTKGVLVSLTRDL